MASGAVMLNFLRSRGDDIISYNPIDYTPKLNENWVKYKFRKPFILVDFRYHPAANWWFDHHQTSFTWPALKSWGQKYKNDNQHFRDPKFKSCASLVSAHLTAKYNYESAKHIKELCKWVDIVDSMGFKSAKEAISYNKPGFKMMAYLDSESNQKKRKKIIKLLAEESVTRIIKRSDVAQKAKHHAARVLKITMQLKTTARVSGSVVFVDATQINKFSVHHYMVYYLFPRTKYSILLKRNGDYFSLGVGANLWSKSSKFADIGRLMAEYGGGGHWGVGATQKKSKNELLKIAEEVIKYLNKHG